tara:strand:+ start:787 stop:1404 length:618 start_codon:yes stop_codon:yes gene_type:complete
MTQFQYSIDINKKKNMRVLVACEYSGIVRNAFRERGHDAWSCDILETESPGQHLKKNVLEIINDGWDLMIAHPPCTHLSVSGQWCFTQGKKQDSLRDDAIEFVKKLMDAPIDKICIENPRSIISSRIRPADQLIHPYQYGHLECKETCLWLKNLPKLKPTKNVKSETMLLPNKEKYKKLWIGGYHGKERSEFFTGIAKAMAEQWG